MRQQTRREWLVWSLGGAAGLVGSLRAGFAQSPKQSGTVTISQVQVAFIGSGTAGGGTLTFRGKKYPFKLGGLGIGGFGVSRLEATGTVYNLNKLQDFNGVYGQARTGWAAGTSGKGDMWVQNPNGVYMRLRARRSGLALSLGADGLVVQLS